MARAGTGFFDNSGNFFKSADDATVSDLAALFGPIGEDENAAYIAARMILERRSEIAKLLSEHDALVNAGQTNGLGTNGFDAGLSSERESKPGMRLSDITPKVARMPTLPAG
ncbi:MAG: hypothetical protein V2I27_09590 [Erythrobacter sp.]|nr:hypothetical protein [Erythrobacter sp.]